jgi:hypothetical protein
MTTCASDDNDTSPYLRPIFVSSFQIVCTIKVRSLAMHVHYFLTSIQNSGCSLTFDLLNSIWPILYCEVQRRSWNELKSRMKEEAWLEEPVYALPVYYPLHLCLLTFSILMIFQCIAITATVRRKLIFLLLFPTVSVSVMIFKRKSRMLYSKLTSTGTGASASL